ncbi:MAG: hypothetical protein AABX75_01450 [Nanoarchaeota archaeon]
MKIKECTKEWEMESNFIPEPGYPVVWQEVKNGEIKTGGELFYTNERRVVRETGGFWKGGYQHFLRENTII